MNPLPGFEEAAHVVVNAPPFVLRLLWLLPFPASITAAEPSPLTPPPPPPLTAPPIPHSPTFPPSPSPSPSPYCTPSPSPQYPSVSDDEAFFLHQLSPNALVLSVEFLLNERIQAHTSPLPSADADVSAFYGIGVPALSLTQYIHRLVHYTDCSPALFVVMIILVSRAAPVLPLCEYNVHRVLVAALLVAVKAGDDRVFTLDHYMKVGGVPSTAEIATLEVLFLAAVDWHVLVRKEEFDETLHELRQVYDNLEGDGRNCGDANSVSMDTCPVTETYTVGTNVRVWNALDEQRESDMVQTRAENRKRQRDDRRQVWGNTAKRASGSSSTHRVHTTRTAYTSIDFSPNTRRYASNDTDMSVDMGTMAESESGSCEMSFQSDDNEKSACSDGTNGKENESLDYEDEEEEWRRQDEHNANNSWGHNV